MTVVTEVVIMTSFSKNTFTPWQPTTLRAAIRNSCDVYVLLNLQGTQIILSMLKGKNLAKNVT